MDSSFISRCSTQQRGCRRACVPCLSEDSRPRSLLPNSVLLWGMWKENWHLLDSSHVNCTLELYLEVQACIQQARSKAQHLYCSLPAPGWEQRGLSDVAGWRRATPNCVWVCGYNQPLVPLWETESSQRDEKGEDCLETPSISVGQDIYSCSGWAGWREKGAVTLIKTCPTLEANDWCGGEKGQHWLWVALMVSKISRNP